MEVEEDHLAFYGGGRRPSASNGRGRKPSGLLWEKRTFRSSVEEFLSWKKIFLWPSYKKPPLLLWKKKTLMRDKLRIFYKRSPLGMPFEYSIEDEKHSLTFYGRGFQSLNSMIEEEYLQIFCGRRGHLGLLWKTFFL